MPKSKRLPDVPEDLRCLMKTIVQYFHPDRLDRADRNAGALLTVASVGSFHNFDMAFAIGYVI